MCINFALGYLFSERSKHPPEASTKLQTILNPIRITFKKGIKRDLVSNTWQVLWFSWRKSAICNWFMFGQFFKCTVRLVTGEKALPFLTNGLRFLPIAIKLSMLALLTFYKGALSLLGIVKLWMICECHCARHEAITTKVNCLEKRRQKQLTNGPSPKVFILVVNFRDEFWDDRTFSSWQRVKMPHSSSLKIFSSQDTLLLTRSHAITLTASMIYEQRLMHKKPLPKLSSYSWKISQAHFYCIRM